MMSRFTYFIGITFAALALLACANKRSDFDARPLEEVQYLQSTLTASKFQACESINSTIRLSAPIQNARIVWQEQSPILVYEGIFREAIKTVWQPLSKKFQQDGEGVVVGQRGMTFVGDFQTSSDAAGGFWTNYRFKIPGTEMYAIAVEYLAKTPKPAKAKNEKNNIIRLGMPQNVNDTAQRSWIIPLSQPGTAKTTQEKQIGMAHVIVKTVSVIPGSIENSETTYTWYILQANQGRVKKMGEYKVKDIPLTIEKFLLSRETTDPIGIGISTESIGKQGSFSSKESGTNTIFAIRPFAAGAPTHILHQDDRPLSSLAVGDTNNCLETAQVAWIREPVDTPHPSIEWLSTNIKTPGTAGTEPLSAKKRKHLSRNIATKRIPLGYFPSQLDFVKVPTENNTIATALSWWGGTDQERGLIITRVAPTERATSRDPENIDASERTTKPFTRAFVSRDELGSPFGVTFSPNNDPALIIVYADTTRQDTSATASKIRFCRVTKSQLFE